MTSNGIARGALMALDAFLGLTAVAGGVALLTGWISPSVDLLRGSPFSSYLIPGLVLLVVVGGSGLVATLAVLRQSAWGPLASTVAGLMILGFEAVELTIIGPHWLQAVYVAVGLLIIALALPVPIGRWRPTPVGHA
jgi:hypothetical protein